MNFKPSSCLAHVKGGDGKCPRSCSHQRSLDREGRGRKQLLFLLSDGSEAHEHVCGQEGHMLPLKGNVCVSIIAPKPSAWPFTCSLN